MDREGDSYRLLSALVEQGHRFVIRVARDRCVIDEDDEPLKLSETLCGLDDLVEVEVPLSRRAASPMPGKRGTHPPRRARTARLAFSAVAMALKRPQYLTNEPETLPVHFIHVREIEPPDGEEPVAWVLVTTEPIRTAADVTAIIEHYRTRWLIEEFFRALKTGCRIEERQLESFAALTNALAIFVPIAWQMLVLRHLARTAPEAPAQAVLSDVQIEALTACAKSKLPPRPSVRDALFAIAALGGHIKHNGEPGWQTLARGLEQLNIFAAGWSAALSAARRADQPAALTPRRGRNQA
ncbi:Transposase [Minicystis rosea]|nr:Transposase [Minicystis rosea]